MAVSPAKAARGEAHKMQLERRFSKMEMFGTRLNSQNADSLNDTMELLEPITDHEMGETADLARRFGASISATVVASRIRHHASTRGRNAPTRCRLAALQVSIASAAPKVEH